jgi:hypothetical protein
LRICLSPAPFCNLQSQRNGAGPFCSAVKAVRRAFPTKDQG